MAGRIALHFAATAGNDEAIKILIHSYVSMLAQHGYTESSTPEEWWKFVGEFVDAVDDDGDNTVIKAAASSNPDAVRRLLYYSSKPFATNHQGQDARAFANNSESKLLL